MIYCLQTVGSEGKFLAILRHNLGHGEQHGHSGTLLHLSVSTWRDKRVQHSIHCPIHSFVSTSVKNNPILHSSVHPRSQIHHLQTLEIMHTSTVGILSTLTFALLARHHFPQSYLSQSMTKPAKPYVHPAKTQISPWHPPNLIWVFAMRFMASLNNLYVLQRDCKDSDQTAYPHFLISLSCPYEEAFDPWFCHEAANFRPNVVLLC